MNIDELLKVCVSDLKEEAEEQSQESRIDEVIRALTLEELVEPAKADTVKLSEAGFGDQAESYTLNLPSYENFSESYAFDYTSQAVELNDKTTQATYTIEVTDEAVYEAAWEVLDSAKLANQTGQKQADTAAPLATREHASMFKLFNPMKWMMMYENPMLKSLYF